MNARAAIVRLAVMGSLAALPRIAAAIQPAPVAPSLTHVRRIYMEPLTGGATSDQMRDMIITALQNTKLFIVTDNQDNADATLRGSADDRIFTEEHSMSEALGLHANAGGGGASNNSMGGGSSSHQTAGASITDNENSHIQERRHEASASIRLVNEDGDVIWSTTQESSGGKFRGAMADVADKIARQLLEDTRKARSGH
jgi:hypothetical protein